MYKTKLFYIRFFSDDTPETIKESPLQQRPRLECDESEPPSKKRKVTASIRPKRNNNYNRYNYGNRYYNQRREHFRKKLHNI